MNSPNEKNKIVLLNNDTIFSQSLVKLYSQNRIIYKQYEGFLVFTDDTLFHNPILIPRNTINRIKADIISADGIKRLLSNSIEKIQYRLDMDSSQHQDVLLKYLEKQYILVPQHTKIQWTLQNFDKQNVGKITRISGGTQLLIELYPTFAE